ncbi:hypothetical protein TNCV_27161 [Trichonephila clavipes]|uniref:Uncharacterized protein n=1 Tax=Trichonephila clavipes TaxID=2585209 RepID=A0A8X7BMB6_TRICX|nr:hypothetical protein TNCV_27161 [Trichonephila clavipes]
MCMRHNAHGLLTYCEEVDGIWKQNFVEGMCCFAPPLVMGGHRSPKLQLQFLQLPCLQETEFCGRNVLFCPTSVNELLRVNTFSRPQGSLDP